MAWDKDKAVAFLQENAEPGYGVGKCATYVRQAIEAGGLKVYQTGSGSAKDYGSRLAAAGFVAQAQQQGVSVAPGDWYLTPSATERAPSPVAPAAVRLTLGAEPNRSRLEGALRTLATVLRQAVGLHASNL